MRVAFCGGGTGGHVYPALTVADALRRESTFDGPELLYIGVRGKMDAELVARAGLPFKAVTARPLRVGNATGTAKGGLALAAGSGEAMNILRGFRPDVVFATGGYGSAGVGLAAWLMRKPLLLFLPDVEAGLAVKALMRFATRIAVSNDTARAAMPSGKATVTGYPVRRAFFEAERSEARAKLGFRDDLPLLLISGASSGASRINQAVTSWLSGFLERSQVLHICGQADEAWMQSVRGVLPEELRERYHVHGYLHEDMALALAAADLAVMRSGASTLGELPATRLPAVLVPGEYEGWDQSPNARYLDDLGAAVMLPQQRMATELESTVTALLADPARLTGMREALTALARPRAAEDIAAMLIEMAGRGSRAAA